MNVPQTNRPSLSCPPTKACSTIYHAKHRKELILEASGYSVRDYTPEDIASMTGESILPSLMKSPSELEDAIIEGRRLYYMLENELGKQ